MLSFLGVWDVLVLRGACRYHVRRPVPISGDVMKDFGAWFADQGKSETEEVDDVFNIRCGHCGKEEYISVCEYESGDSGWHTDEKPVPGDAIWGLCGGGPGCTP